MRFAYQLPLDFGVLLSQDLRPREQCISARNRANRILCFVVISLSNGSVDVTLTLYLAFLAKKKKNVSWAFMDIKKKHMTRLV